MREHALPILRTAAAAVLVVAVLALVGHLALGATYAGVREDDVARAAAEVYARDLRRVVGAIVRLLVAAAAVVAVVAHGAVALARPAGWARGGLDGGARAGVCAIVALALVGASASAHPGLYLPLLAGSEAASAWARACRWLWPALLVAAAVGWTRVAIAGPRALRAILGAAAPGVAIAAIALSRSPLTAPAYRAWTVPASAAPTTATATATTTATTTSTSTSTATSAATTTATSTSTSTTTSTATSTVGREGGRATACASGTSGCSATAAGVGGPTATATSTSSPTPTRVAPPLRGVLVLAVDSLRPDRIDPEHTPHLAALVAESVYFPSTWVTQPRTAPSWASMLTSLPPMLHGVETMFPDRTRRDLSKVALPAHLRALGWRTAVSSEYAGEMFDRIDFGFEAVGVPRVELGEIVAQTVLLRHPLALAVGAALYTSGPRARAIVPAPLGDLLRGLPSFSHPEVLEQDLDAFLGPGGRRGRAPGEGGVDDGRPLFAVLFFSEPHFPYASSSPWYRRWADDGAPARLRWGRDVTREEPVRSPADRAQLDALYRGALAETDAAVGRAMASLRAGGLLDDTIVVLVSDHGEALYECDECAGHGDNLRGSMALRVPMAFRLPRGPYPDAAAAVVREPVSQLDLYPTLLALLGLPPVALHEGVARLDGRGSPVAAPPGQTFFAETGEWLWTTPAVPADRIVYPPITAAATIEDGRIVIDPRWLPVVRAAKHRAAIRPPWKLLYRPGRRGVAWTLHDMDRDPLDERDVAGQNPSIAADLREALRRSVLRHPAMLPAGDYFLTRPAAPPEEYY